MANLTYVPGNLITKCQFGPCVTAAFNDQCGHVRSNVWFLHVTVLTTLHSCGRSSHTGVCVSHTGVCVWLTLYKKVESVAIASALQTEAARRCASPYPLQLRHPCHVWSRRTYPLPSYSVSTADTLRYALTLTSFLWPLPLTFVYLSLHAPLRCLLTHLAAPSTTPPSFCTFRLATAYEISKILLNVPHKQSDSDPITFWLLIPPSYS